MINVEYLFIRDKNLRDFSYILINIFFNQPALICKHTIYYGLLFFHRLRSLHLAIVYTTHTQRIEYFLICHLFYTVFPEFVNSRSIIHIIISPFPSSFPLAGSAASHRFAMGSPHKNAVFLRHFPIPFRQKERKGALVHSRPVSISPQTEQQLKNTFVGTRTDLTFHF